MKKKNVIKETEQVAYEAKKIRSQMGMTQAQLAGRVHNTQKLITRIENCEVDPRLSTLKKIAEGLNCELEIKLKPKENVHSLLEKKAEDLARELVMNAAANFAIELQKPSEKVIQYQIQKMKKVILKKRRELLWGKN